MKSEFRTSMQAKLSPFEFQKYMDYCLALKYEEEPDYIMLLRLIESVAKRERIDLDDRCFDWNLIKASQCLYSSPVVQEQNPNQIRSYSDPT